MKRTLSLLLLLSVAVGISAQKIDRQKVVMRNNPFVNRVDSLSSLSVGNGGFAFTVDATGLQTFPETYRNGVPLGTMSDWGWHSFPNVNNYKPQEAMREYDFGHGHKEIYAIETRQPGRQRDAIAYLRANPHRLHLGIIGLAIPQSGMNELKNIRQSLDMWNGIIDSRFSYLGKAYHVQTVCHPTLDMVSTRVVSKSHTGIVLRFPYPTGNHTDDACRWDADNKHSTDIVSTDKKGRVVLRRTLDATVYYVKVAWQGRAVLKRTGRNSFLITPKDTAISLSCEFCKDMPDVALPSFKDTKAVSSAYWNSYWQKGGIVDFSHVKDARARELERRVVLSQYLLAVNDAGDTPPQETGLTYNSWFGKFHLEMIWWHQAAFALYGHPELLDKSLSWYFKAAPMARQIALREGFKGLRWMKMTDPSAAEAPSGVGSFLIWQQPHLIYLAELLRRAGMNVDKYDGLVDSTAQFMYDFASVDSAHNNRYVLKGCIPAQETLDASKVVNPPFELSYWHYAMQVAQQWRAREGKPLNADWTRLIDNLSPLAYNSDSLYLAAETAVDTYRDIRFTSDHPALLGALGILPDNKLINHSVMSRTLDWIWNNWNWNKTWGWDYPMVAMTAARLGEPQKAVDALLMNKRTNTYLVSGHNYQDQRLRIYLQGTAAC